MLIGIVAAKISVDGVMVKLNTELEKTKKKRAKALQASLKQAIENKKCEKLKENKNFEYNHFEKEDELNN